MRLRRCGCAVALTLSAGCSVPARDNPRDSANAPVAALSIVDFGFPGAAGCGGAPFGSVVAASRGRCLQLDASASVDPQGNTLSFDFDRVSVSSNGEIALLDELDELDGLLSRVLLPDDIRRQLPVSTAENPQLLHFRVTVRDGRSGSSQAIVPLQLFNAEPVAAAGTTRTLPLGGYAWAAGQPMQVSFDAIRSSDPDADALLYCWLFPAGLDETSCARAPDPDGFLCSPEVDDPCFTRTMESSIRRRVRAVLAVRDNLDAPLGDPRSLRSREVAHVVSVDDPVVWVVPGYTSLASSSRLDTAREAVPLPSPSPMATFPPGDGYSPSVAAVSVLDREGSSAVAVGYSGDTGSSPFVFQYLDILTWPDLEPAISLHPLPSGGGPMKTVAVAFDPAREKLWALAHGSADWQLERWSIPANVASSSRDAFGPVAMAAADPLESIKGFGFLAVDVAGTAWLSRSGSNQLLSVREDFSQGPSYVSPFDDQGLPTRVVQAVAPRPGRAEVWVPWVDFFLLSVPAVISVHSLETSPLERPLPVASVSSLGWVDDSTLWVLSAERGAVLLDADTFLAEGFDAAILLEVMTNEVPPVPTLSVVDPASGEVWFAGVTSTVRVALDGRLDLFAPTNPLATESGGAVWFQRICPTGTICSAFQFVERGLSTGAAPIVWTSEYFARRQGGIDQTTGGLWYQNYAGRLVQADDRGGTLQILSTVTLDGVTDSVPPRYWDLSISPDGRDAWGTDVEFNSFPPSVRRLYHVDLDDPARAVTTVVTSTADRFAEAVHASAPLPASTPFVWFDDGTRNERTVFTADGSKTVTARFTVPAGECFQNIGCQVLLRAARSPKSNALCVATLDEDATNACKGSAGNCVLHLRRIPPVGAIEDLGTIPHIPNSAVAEFGVGAGGDDARDLCWVASWIRGSTSPVRITAVESAGAQQPMDCTQGVSQQFHCFVGPLGGTDASTFASGLSLFPSDPHTLWMASDARTWKLEFDPGAVDQVLVVRSDYGIGGYRLSAP